MDNYVKTKIMIKIAKIYKNILLYTRQHNSVHARAKDQRLAVMDDLNTPFVPYFHNKVFRKKTADVMSGPKYLNHVTRWWVL